MTDIHELTKQRDAMDCAYIRESRKRAEAEALADALSQALDAVVLARNYLLSFRRAAERLRGSAKVDGGMNYFIDREAIDQFDADIEAIEPVAAKGMVT